MSQKEILEKIDTNFNPNSAEQIKKKFKKREYDLLFVYGHGRSDGIRFTDDYSLTEKDVQIFESFQGSLDRNIVLYSCSTGFYEGIAELIAKTARVKTFASVDSCNDYEIDLGTEFKIDFFDPQRQVITRVIGPNGEDAKD